jgi:hypothetical protein
MKKFRQGGLALRFLLEQGTSASAMLDHPLRPGWGPGPCTALIWAIFQKPWIVTEGILVLLSQMDAGMLQVSFLDTSK